MVFIFNIKWWVDGDLIVILKTNKKGGKKEKVLA